MRSRSNLISIKRAAGTYCSDDQRESSVGLYVWECQVEGLRLFVLMKASRWWEK